MPTSYAGHPGGQLLLDSARQSECPGLLFLSYHIGADVDGKVAPSARAQKIDVPQRGKIYSEMHLAIRKVKLEHPEVHNYFIAYCLALTVALLVAFIWFLVAPGLKSCLFATVMFELYFLNVFHTRHHQGGEIYENKLLRRFTTPLYEFIDSTWGYYPRAWHLNHHVKHHVFTNDKDTDTDVPSMWPMVRSCHDQPKLWFHKMQSFYFPLLVPFAAVNFPLNNFIKHGGSTFHFTSWIVIMFVLPVLIHGWPGLVYALLTEGLAGAALAYKFAVSHAHNDLRTQSTSEEVYGDIDKWIAAQVEESISYGGFLTTFMLGGINMQIEHHIAPALDPPLYYYIAPEIQQICRKYGVQYTAEPSLFHAVWQFHEKLHAMG
jgi:fatty acid desaturase